MNKRILFIIFILSSCLFLALPKRALAVDKNTANSSSEIAVRADEDKKNIDGRILKLKNFLKGYPLRNSAESFVKSADKYNLTKQAYLVAAIACVESTCGEFIPNGSYNAWGFGIPTGAKSGLVFNSWDKGIEEVTKTISQNYLKNTANYENLSAGDIALVIGPIYAADPNWASKVIFFLNEIEAAPAVPEISTLPLNL